MDSMKKIVIYSVGLLGGSLGAGFKQSGFTGEIVGISSERSIADAKAVGAIDKGYSYDNAEEAIANADLLFICSPINAIIKTLETLSQMKLPKGLIITDVGSTKSEIIAAAEKLLPSHVTFIGGHPMAGSEKSGAAATDSFLFQNAVYVLTQSTLSTPNQTKDLATFLTNHLGCRTVELDPRTHDMITATVSHVPHIVAVAMVNVAAQVENEIPGTLNLAAGGFKSLTRIASSPYTMWHDIYQTNKEANLSVLQNFIAELQQMEKDLEEGNLKESFDNAAETRKSLQTGKKGFLSALYEIVVVAEDRPGFLAKMTTLLAESDINIRDIELLKVREGEAGTFMLGFSSEEDADKACTVLNSNNFSARSR